MTHIIRHPYVKGYSFYYFATMIKHVVCACLLLNWVYALGQFSPQAGKAGTTAIHRDSSIIKLWANQCSINRGWQNIADTSLGKAQVGDESYVPGKAGNGIVSLGDAGEAVVTFAHPIQNGAGFDFVVFENGFIDQSIDTGTAYLELALVSVSSDGMHYFQFPAQSLTDTNVQLGPFAGIRAEKLHNIAGKYVAPFGTPFDLDDIPDTSLLNKQAITHVRIRDVVGSLLSQYASYDILLRAINDPWPTPFASSGFDLDAVGVIHPNFALSAYEHNGVNSDVSIYPNPARANQPIHIVSPHSTYARLTDVCGNVIAETDYVANQEWIVRLSTPGVYMLVLKNGNSHDVKKLVLH